MSEENKQSLESPEQTPERVEAFVEKVRSGTPIESVPVFEISEQVEVRLVARESLRHKALEVHSDELFYEAMRRLQELMYDENGKVAVAAASKIVDLRRDVYKVQASKKQTQRIMDKLFDDGFDF